MSFKQLCSPVAAITCSRDCVAYRGICLLKDHSCNRNFWVMHLPNVLVGVVCANYHVIPLRKASLGQCIYLVLVVTKYFPA